MHSGFRAPHRRVRRHWPELARVDRQHSGGHGFDRRQRGARHQLLMLVAARRGLEAFNQGRFYVAHEAWEDVWKAAPPSERPYYRALIQLAAACLKIEQGHFGPARRLLERARGELGTAGLTPPCLSTTLETLLDDLEGPGPERPEGFSATWPPTLVLETP
ncbi:MAG TPA: DUF309 domain-containing protein [Stenomitos sp.]